MCHISFFLSLVLFAGLQKLTAVNFLRSSDFWFATKNCQKSKISTLTAEGRHSEFRPSRAREAAGWGCQTRPFEHDTMGFGAKNMLIRLIGHVLFASFIGRGQRPRSKRNRFPPTRTSTVYCDNFRFGQNWLKSGENLKEELHFRFPMALMHFQWGKIQSSQPDFSKLQRIRTVWPRALCSRALSVRKHRVTRQPRPKALARGRIWDFIFVAFFFFFFFFFFISPACWLHTLRLPISGNFDIFRHFSSLRTNVIVLYLLIFDFEKAFAPLIIRRKSNFEPFWLILAPGVRLSCLLDNLLFLARKTKANGDNLRKCVFSKNGALAETRQNHLQHQARLLIRFRSVWAKAFLMGFFSNSPCVKTAILIMIFDLQRKTVKNQKSRLWRPKAGIRNFGRHGHVRLLVEAARQGPLSTIRWVLAPKTC